MLPPDSDLIARVIVKDDRHAFGELVRRYQSQVRSMLRRLTSGDLALADDLAQETFVRAYRSIKKYQGGGKFGSWLYRIAYNAFLTEHAKIAKRRKTQEAALEMQQQASKERASFKHDLAKAMAFLSTQEQAAIALAYAADATHEDIASALECPIGTVKSHIVRAKEKLKKRLHAWAHTELS